MFSHRAKYAIKALIHLAHCVGQGPVHAHTIAAEGKIPERFLELILVQLRKGGLVRSRAGRGGGHQLQGSPDAINLLAVIHAIDEQIDPLPCLSSTAYVRCPDCDDESACPTRHLFIEIQEKQSALLSQVILASVMPKSALSASPSASPTSPAYPTMPRNLTDPPLVNTMPLRQSHQST